MKRIFIVFWIVLIISIYSQGGAASANSQNDNLDNKTIIARIYSDWRSELPAVQNVFVPFGREETYKTIKAKINNRSFSIEPSQIPTAESGTEVVVLLHPYDQADEDVKNSLNSTIYILPINKVPDFRFQTAMPDHRRNHTLLDALKKPVADCRAEIFIADSFDLSKVWAGTIVTDANGHFKMPGATGPFGQFYLFIKDPNYGSFYVRVDKFSFTPNLQPNPEPNAVLTAVNVRSEFFDRSIRGFVETADGKPVWGATIECGSARTPAGAIVFGSIDSTKCQTITDENGRFVLYMAPRITEPEAQIPPLSRYEITVRPPQWSILAPYRGYIQSGQDSKIVLEQTGIVRQFIFQDSNGLITNSKVLGGINVVIETADKKTLRLPYSELRIPKATPAGKYSVVLTNPGTPIVFEPLDITDQPVVVFEAKRRKSAYYTGKIVDAATGQPLQDVYLLLGGGDFDGQELLKQLTPLDKVISPQVYNFSQIAVTDKNGVFELSVEPDSFNKAFFIFKKDYIPIRYMLGTFVSRISSAKDNEGNFVLDTFDLLPCAYVVYEPCCDPEEIIETKIKDPIYDAMLSLINIHAEVIVQYINPPKWYSDYYGKYYKRKPGSSGSPPAILPNPFRQRPNTENMRIIPAGVGVQLNIQLVNSDKDSKAKRSYPVITDVLNCQQGETINLGKIYFGEEINVFVKVTDSAGKILQGVEVRHVSEDGTMYYGHRDITDANGIVKVKVPVDIKTAFFVGRTGPNSKKIKQLLPYQPKGPEDANSIITFQVNDEVVRDLFDPNAVAIPKSRIPIDF